MAPPVQPSAQPNELPTTPTDEARAAAVDQRRARAIAEKAATMEKLAATAAETNVAQVAQ